MAFGDLVETKVDGDATVDDSLSITFAAAPAENNLILLCIGALTEDHSIDTAGFTEIAALAGLDGTDQYRVWQKVAGASEGTTFAATTVAAERDKVMLGIVFEGPFAASPVDQTSQGTKETGSGSTECPTITPSEANTLAVAFGYGNPDYRMVNGRMNSGDSSGHTFRGSGFADDFPGTFMPGFIFSTEVRAGTSAIGEVRMDFIDSGTTSRASDYHWGAQANFKQGTVGGASIDPIFNYYYRTLMGS